MFWGIIIRDLVHELRPLFQDTETMCETFGNIKHFPVLGRKQDREELAESFGLRADIHRHVVDGPAKHAHELGLRAWRDLKMQAPEHTLGGRADIILDEIIRDAVFGKKFFAVTFVEEAARVVKDLGLNHDHTVDFSLNKVHVMSQDGE